MFKKATKNSFAKNVSILMSGTAVSQGLTIAAAPILSRLYDPEAFGAFAIYTAIVTILSVIVTMKYESAIVIAHNNEEAKNVFYLSNIIVFLISFFTFIIIIFFKEEIAQIAKIPEISHLLWWVPISILSMGIYQNLLYWNTRRKQFKRTAVTQVSRSVVVVGSQIISGLFSKGSTGLIGGQVAGQIVSSSVLGIQTYKEDKEIIKEKTSFKELREVAFKFKDFPMYSAPQSLFNSISQNLPTFLLTYFFGAEILGYFALSLKFIQMPLNFITQSFRQVFFQKVTESINKGNNYLLILKKMTLILFSIAIAPSLVIALFGSEIYSFILGEKWIEAGRYAEWLILGLFFGFLNSPAFVTAQALRLQKYLLRYEVVLLLSRAAVLYIGGVYLDAYKTIILYSLVGGVFNLSLITGIFIFVIRKARSIKIST